MNELPKDVEKRLYEFTRWHTQDEVGYKKLRQFLFEEIKQAREEEKRRIFNETASLIISYGKGEDWEHYKFVNEIIKKIWLILGAKQDDCGTFYLEEHREDK